MEAASAILGLDQTVAVLHAMTVFLDQHVTLALVTLHVAMEMETVKQMKMEHFKSVNV
jgi:hypothetical protein